jgi:cysteine desulfurase/selenocysteine lyase
VVVRDRGDGYLDLDELARLVDERTLAVCTTHVSHSFGSVQPIAQVAAIAQRAGAITVVDGAQAVGRIPVDIASLSCDAYIGVGRKALLSPVGAGFLAARLELLNRTKPLLLSTRSAQLIDVGNSEYIAFPPPRSLEGTLPDLESLSGLAGSLTAFLKLGPEAIPSHIHTLLLLLTVRMADLGLKPARPVDPSRNAGIVTYHLAPHHPSGEMMRRLLHYKRLVIASGGGTIRLSLHLSNSARGIEKLTRELSEHI